MIDIEKLYTEMQVLKRMLKWEVSSGSEYFKAMKPNVSITVKDPLAQDVLNSSSDYYKPYQDEEISEEELAILTR